MPAYRTEHPPSTSQLLTRFTGPKGRFADAGLPNTQISGPRTRFIRGRDGDFPMAVGLREVPYLQFLAGPKDEFLCILLVQPEGGSLTPSRPHYSELRGKHFPSHYKHIQTPDSLLTIYNNYG